MAKKAAAKKSATKKAAAKKSATEKKSASKAETLGAQAWERGIAIPCAK